MDCIVKHGKAKRFALNAGRGDRSMPARGKVPCPLSVPEAHSDGRMRRTTVGGTTFGRDGSAVLLDYHQSPITHTRLLSIFQPDYAAVMRENHAILDGIAAHQNHR